MPSTVELVHDMIGRARICAEGQWHESAFRPVFCHEGGILVPVFVTAEPVGASGGPFSPVLDMLARQMHRDNLFLRDPDGLGYSEQLPSWQNGESDLPSLLAAGKEAGMEACDLWCDFSAQGHQVPDLLGKARALGMRIITGLPEMGTGGRAAGKQADIVRLGPEWETGSLTDLPATVTLMRGLCQRIIGQGSAVWLDGVTSPAMLDAALEAGVTHVSGDWVARPVLAGCITGWRPLNADAMRREGGVVALRQRG